MCTLSCTQKDWQDPVIALYSSPCASQLVEALADSLYGLRSALTADDSPNKLLHQLWTVVSFLQQSKPWGPALAATPGLLYDHSQLWTVSDLPSNIIRYFVQHVGLHINYQQMITAAHKRVAGLETWVQHQQRHSIQTNIPDIVANLCCSYPSWDEMVWLANWQPTNPKHLVDMLQVMLNCSPSRCSWTDLNRVAPVQLSRMADAAAILHLLTTAVARGRHRVVKAALELPVAQQFNAASVSQLMLADVAADEEAGTIASSSSGDMMGLLVQFPAASNVARRDIMLLLERYLATGNHAAVKALCTLSAIRTSTVRSIVKLLSMATRLSVDEAVATLCSLPAAKNISGHEWVILATTAIQGELRRGSAELCKLPNAAQAADEVVAELLSSAVFYEVYAAAEALVSLPAAASIPPDQVLELTEQLVTCAATGPRTGYGLIIVDEDLVNTLKAFGRLKAVQDMSSTELLELLTIAMQHGGYDSAYGWLGPVVKWLAKLPATSSIPAEVMQQQMQEAVQQRKLRLLSALCELPAATHVDADALLQLLNIARQEDSDNSRSIQRLLCKLTAHMQLSHSQRMAFVLAAISLGQSLSECSGKRGWTKQLTTSNIVDLLSTAAKSDNCDNLNRLCGLAAAASISSTVLVELISAVLDRHDCWAGTLRSLCSLPGAQQIPHDVAAVLISKAEKWGNWRIIQALLPLQRRHSTHASAVEVRYNSEQQVSPS